MEYAVKRIGVLTSGGDAPGMNAAIRAVARTATRLGIECVGIRRGWNGLINGDILPLDAGSVRSIINRGGTMLYTARSEEFRTEEGQKKAANTCKLLGLDGIVAIGGDGTFRGAQDLSRFGVSVVGVPGTIDNDIVCTDYTVCAIRCSRTIAAASWRSLAATRGILRSMSAWPSARPLFLCRRRCSTLRRTLRRKSAAPVSAARRTS